MKIKLVVVAVAMFLSIGGANAEISTLVKSVSDKTVKLPDGMQCFVQSRAFFGNGDKSPLSEYFVDGGLKVAGGRGVPCTIVVGASVSLLLNPSDPGSVKPILADYILSNEKLKSQMVEAALQSTTLAQEASKQDKTPHTIGQNVGAIVGSSFGTVIGVGMTGIGSLFDDNKKELPAGVAAVYADLKFKDEQGKSHRSDFVVYAASTSKELPGDLLRAAVKRVVAEIQAQPEAPSSSGASAQTEIPTPEVH